MKIFFILISIIRPYNALLTAAAVSLGFWLSGACGGILKLILLMVAAGCAIGFGNVINDIKDIETDRISHRERPLPQNKISVTSAFVLSLILAACAVTGGFWVSPVHGVAVIIPLFLLTLYTLYLKNTPLAGNMTVALLVAYPLLFGALGAPGMGRLVIPAGLAFLLNFPREIIKDIQDKSGDSHNGLKTSARLPEGFLKGTILICSIVYLLCLFVPYILHYFGAVYAAVCGVIILPLHGYRMYVLLQKQWERFAPRISLLLKLEMVAGLFALGMDELVKIYK